MNYFFIVPLVFGVLLFGAVFESIDFLVHLPDEHYSEYCYKLEWHDSSCFYHCYEFNGWFGAKWTDCIWEKKL